MSPLNLDTSTRPVDLGLGSVDGDKNNWKVQVISVYADGGSLSRLLIHPIIPLDA